ncbi:hypothetical protein BZL30_0096 [Mycobacterium kansasii]|uniref:Uncharacterized protein n=1 Tax=Mycobacterium kansasii TaxID=1768 RepID=A0A1V3XS35_MYCKA|nr:hypothetical protein BZL30_0096 [Mycobacterium kansasii]
MPRATSVHLPNRGEHLRRPSRTAWTGLDALRLAVGDQGVEVEPDGIRMYFQRVGNRNDAHRNA